ncbi:hypothetical protein Tco_1485818 [Tanacetum coccineum]
MKTAVDQCFVDKNVFKIQIKQRRIDNDQLLNQIMSQEIVHIVANFVDSFDVKNSYVNDCSKCLELETELLKKKDFIENEAYDKLVKKNSGENLNAPTFNQLFEINKLKSQLQEKDTVIRKLKERIKSLSGKHSLENVKKEIDKIETINIELEHSVAKLLLKNENLRKEREHLKSIYKDQFDSIRKTRVQPKEHCDSLIAQINAKSVENSDLNAQLPEKVFANAALKNELRKIKGKNVVDTAVSKDNATIALGMFKHDIEPISPRLKNNRDSYEVYIEKTIEYTDTLRGFVERARTQNPSEPLLESACIFTKQVQELYFSFGRHLDELHVTWAHLEKKRTRLQTNTKTLEDLCSQSLEMASQAIHDAVTTHQEQTFYLGGHGVRDCHHLTPFCPEERAPEETISTDISLSLWCEHAVATASAQNDNGSLESSEASFEAASKQSRVVLFKNFVASVSTYSNNLSLKMALNHRRKSFENSGVSTILGF